MPVNFNGIYTQNFDTLATSGTANPWTNDTTIAGWFLFNQLSSGTPITAYNADSGTSTAGSFDSYGTTGATDRALGGLASGGAYFSAPASGTVAGWVAFAARNTTGATVNTLNVSFDGEQWRNGGNTSAQKMGLQYGIGTTFGTVSSWTTPGGTFDWTSPIVGATAVALDGNATANRVASVGGALTNLNWANNDTLWLRWVENNDVGSDHGLAIDNFSLSATTGGGATISIAATDANAAETASDPGVFRISRTGATTSAVTVNYTVSGTATNGTDYNNLTGTASIAVGAAFTDITITPVDDAIVVEGNEAVTLTLGTAPTGYTLGTTTATVTIADNDVATTITKIHDIQGSGSTFNTAFGGVQTIEGIVTSVFGKLSGFYVQEEDADVDADAATSEAIFVYDPTGLFKGNVGDKVNISGTANDFVTNNTTTTPPSTSKLTQFDTLTNVTVVSSGNALPTVTKIQLPVASKAVLERYEGMLVNLSAASGDLTVTENYQLGRYGQVILAATGPGNQAGTDGRFEQYTQFNAPSDTGYAAYLTQLDNRKIYLDDANTTQNPDPEIFARGGNPLSATNTLRSGDTLASVTGILDERFEGYRIQTTSPVNFVASNPRPVTAPAVGGSLKVASFNVLNYFNDLDTGASISIGGGSFQPRGANNAAEFTRQRTKTIAAMIGTGADVFGLMELENNGFGTTSAIQNLVDGLNAVAGAGTYSFITPKTAISTDAITVGMIYKSAKVTPVGDAATMAGGYSAVFDLVGRKPLAQTFKEIATGESFTLVANHFKSKGSEADSTVDGDRLDGQAKSNVTRTRQAQDLAKWLATNPTGTTDTDYLVLGDLNAYAMEDPLTTLAAAGYANLLPTSTYSYVFDGQVGSLDHALGTSSLARQVTGVDEWHINADEPLVLDYNTEFKSAGQVTSFYDATQFRSSDHDPILVGLNLKVAPTRNDFNGDGKSDILWRNTDGSVATWQQNGSIVTPGSVERLTADWTIAGTGDFNGDKNADILLSNADGRVTTWQMNGTSVTAAKTLGTLGAGWSITGTADFNGDGTTDVLFRNTNGTVATWQVNNAAATTVNTLGTLGAGWSIAGTGDFNGDGTADLLLVNTDGSIAEWQLNSLGTTAKSVGKLATDTSIAGIGDFNGDGKADILFRNTNGSVAEWQMNGEVVSNASTIGSATADWKITGTGDFNGDKYADILWRNDLGGVATWQLNGSTVLSAGATSIATAATSWQIAAPI